MSVRTCSLLCCIVLLSVILLGTTPRLSAAEKVDLSKLPKPATGEIDFVKQIQPIFRSKCYVCHGPDAEEGGVRFDSKTRVMDGGDSGPVLKKGDSAHSHLIHLVAELEEDVRMPPVDEGTPLTTQEIALLRRWIDTGAQWPERATGDLKIRGSDHWAFQPIRSLPLPKVKNADWVRNGIDAFILRKLEAEKVTPSPEADRATLVRRLHLDLLGLPPAPEVVAEVMRDKRTDWYERLVDRLLASPHYGERWGRHWLDLARYADSDGYEKDYPRPYAFRYRDWVIDALNKDMPYDQFSIEQLAGDLLPGATRQQRVATGLHRNTLINTEGGTDKEEDRVKRTVDRTNTLGAVWLGLTVECAQCHTHKYDPITQREYFSLYAFFNSLSEPNLGVAPAEEVQKYKARLAAWERETAAQKAKIAEYKKQQSTELPAWEESVSNTVAWQKLTPHKAKALDATLTIQADGTVLATERNKTEDVYTVQSKLFGNSITGLQLLVLPDQSLPGKGPGRSSGGNFVLTNLKAVITSGGKSQDVTFAQAAADFSQKDYSFASAYDDDPESGWAISPQFGQAHALKLEIQEDIVFEPGAVLTLTMEHNYKRSPHNIGKFQILSTTASKPLTFNKLPEKIVKIVQKPVAKRSAKEKEDILDYFSSLDKKHGVLRSELQKHLKKKPEDPNNKQKAQVVAELAKPRTTKIHIRGNFLEKGTEVEIDTFQVLPKLTPRGKQPDRLDLARWLFRPEQPLVARVEVNRVWQRYFGRGIVPTSNNFGTQGDPPSHPDLLDWLATRFRQDGWSFKKLHKLIVTSATYRQSSAVRKELAERDPYNSWLASQKRLRVSAEVIRDLALATSGLLVEEIGGPSVFPPQPKGIEKLTYASAGSWTTSTGKDRYRRGLYTFFRRSSPYPMLSTFDSPDSILSCTRRNRSNTPLQSLTLWNDPVFFECFQALGRRIVAEAEKSSDAEEQFQNRATYAYLVCLGREPNPQELRIIRSQYTAQQELLRKYPEQAKKIVGSRPLAKGAEVTEVAAWILAARTLTNTDEFITKE